MEWCLDWDGTRSYGTDPKGPSSGSSRIARGGCWWRDAAGCTSYRAYHRSPSDTNSEHGYGFRIIEICRASKHLESFVLGLHALNHGGSPKTLLPITHLMVTRTIRAAMETMVFCMMSPLQRTGTETQAGRITSTDHQRTLKCQIPIRSVKSGRRLRCRYG